MWRQAGSLSYTGAMFKPADLFDLNQTAHAALFDGVESAWEALGKIADYVKPLARQVPVSPARPSARTFSSVRARWSSPAR